MHTLSMVNHCYKRFHEGFLCRLRHGIIMKMNSVLHVIAFKKIGMVPNYIFT
jgi:hypothetical protein